MNINTHIYIIIFKKTLNKKLLLSIFNSQCWIISITYKLNIKSKRTYNKIYFPFFFSKYEIYQNLIIDMYFLYKITIILIIIMNLN